MINKSSFFSPSVILAKKRDGHELNAAEINWFVDGVTSGKLPDYQISALLMAMTIQGLSNAETACLTQAMMHSGKCLNFNDHTVIDKHSTGGVGDKTSFILAPIAAACGVKVPMIAGRGLGHTGGTIDKIESINGFNTALDLATFQQNIKKNGLALIGQTPEIAPADKKLYALRDVTATVESIPLITASIMSKKLAEGASGIVMDVKYGSGAFMSTKTQAKKLAKELAFTAKNFNVGFISILTNMNSPLGDAVGNSLEIIESINVLKNQGPKDITELSITLAGAMIYLAELAPNIDAGKKLAKAALKSGAALDKFKLLIKSQAGDERVVDNPSLLAIAPLKLEVLSPMRGHIKKINCKNIGLHCVALGGGRAATGDNIDHGVGFIFHKKSGQKIKKAEPILTIYYNESQQLVAEKIQREILDQDITFSREYVNKKIELIDEIKITIPQKNK